MFKVEADAKGAKVTLYEILDAEGVNGEKIQRRIKIGYGTAEELMNSMVAGVKEAQTNIDNGKKTISKVNSINESLIPFIKVKKRREKKKKSKKK